ncbi:protein kinase [Micromonospora sp. PLK6-60]|uniref:protein kinase domain-containing protein n=1 Tax=Micromonospora sp. PLK6-60 TaxID=2873383 RepID=UPI0027DF5F0A|nr:protein kinase [Micromonospora sp. PLK6-60]
MRQQLVGARYRLRELVGSGGMGRVWLAGDEMLHREVAVKEVVPPAWLAESEREELRLRTMREARTAARLNHPNVVRLYDVVHEGDNPWIVMEYVPSRSLQQIISADGPLEPRRAAQVGLAVLAALRAAHEAGVLHRDVKPHNVLIADDGRVLLTDFGLATFAGGDGAMTGPGLVLGSPQFVAPERARDGASDPRTDLWSLGATLYAAVEGQSPYARPNAMATLSALASEPPAPARRAGPLLPVLTGLLQRDPRRRLTAVEVEPLLRDVAGVARDGPASRAGVAAGLARAAGDPPPAWPGPAPPATGGGTPAGYGPELPRAGGAPPTVEGPELPRAGGAPPTVEGPELPRAGGAPPADGGPELPRAGGGGPRPGPGSVRLRPVPAPRPGSAAPLTASPGATPDRARPGWRRPSRLVGLGVVAVLLAGAGTALALTDRDGTVRPRGSGAGSPAPASAPPSTAGPTTGATGAGAAPARAGAFPCGAAPPGATPVASTRPRAGELALLPGWTWYRDPAGWRIAAPTNWLRWTDDGVACFREPDGFRVLSVATLDPPADPVAHWRAEERRLTGAGKLRGYRLDEIAPVDMFRGGALWECGWVTDAGVPVHTARLLLRTGPQRAYAVAWLTKEFDWQVNREYFLMIRQSFGPGD